VAWWGASKLIRDRSRLALAAIVAATALSPAAAQASPAPSPPLDKTLAPAPAADFAAVDPGQGILQGAFTAAQFASTTASGNKQVQTQTTLQSDGFVAGYAHTWIQNGSGHGLLEAVMAFGGAEGATKWLRASEQADKGSPSYLHPLTLPGVNGYAGAHFAGSDFFADAYALVKGNDFFWVIGISRQDDVTTLTTTQAKAQYDLAPKYTIAPSEWPESKSANLSHPISYYLGRATTYVLFVGLAAVIGLIALSLYVLARRRRIRAMVGPTGPVQMSEDGRYWWDGQTWQDAGQEPHSGRRLPPAAG
jgi:hypothetical protein